MLTILLTTVLKARARGEEAGHRQRAALAGFNRQHQRAREGRWAGGQAGAGRWQAGGRQAGAPQ